MTKVILKYNNRKLYDKAVSKYISLKDIHEMVKADVNFLVVDYVSQIDITRKTVQEAMNAYCVFNLGDMCDMIKNAENKSL